MEIFDIRLGNLRHLIAEHKGPAAFARLTKHTKGYISALAGPNPTRAITEKTARALEKKANKPVGWLDTEHVSVDRVDSELLTQVMSVTRDATKKLDLSSMQFAVLVLLVYDHCQLKGGVEHAKEFLGKMTDLLKGDAKPAKSSRTLHQEARPRPR